MTTVLLGSENQLREFLTEAVLKSGGCVSLYERLSHDTDVGHDAPVSTQSLTRTQTERHRLGNSKQIPHSETTRKLEPRARQTPESHPVLQVPNTHP